MIYSTNLFLDFATPSIDAIALTPEQMAQAAQLSDSVGTAERQWQTYLNTLALLGFEQWLSQRDPELVLEQDNLSTISNVICQLKIGEFKLCLLTQGTLDDETVSIPRTAIESANDIAHFYVLVTVDEEQEQISIEGVMRHDRLKAYQQSGLTVHSDGTYEIPLSWFDPDVNHLLLYLRCLEPSAIQLPNISTAPETQNPISQLTQSVINVGAWLQGELDEFAERLSWMLLPSPELATASFRSLPTLDIILEELRGQAMSIPNTVGGASQNINIGDTVLQLYALTWLLEDSNEWSLLLILGTPTEQPLPQGLKLQIQDLTSILSEQEINADSDRTYLYTRVVGEFDERFTVTIALENGETLTLPPFTFRSEQA